MTTLAAGDDSVLLIADLHLDASRPDTLQAALDTFSIAARHDALWILGDLFEAWIGDDAGLTDPLGRRVAAALSALAASGTRVHLMHGNRDFLLGDTFATAAGATLHREDECVIPLGGAPVLLLHGDTLCSEDEGYRQLRQRLRDPGWQAGFLALPIAERLAAARQLRDASREAGSRKAHDIMDVTPATVHDRLAIAHRGHGAVTMIHGHTHRPAVHELTLAALDDGEPPIEAHRLVLGDWHADGGEAIVADGGGLRRMRCPADTRLPCPV